MKFAENVLKWAYEGHEKQRRSKAAPKVATIDDESVQRIYDLYPSSTIRSDGKKSSLRSAEGDKKEIRRLLATKTEEELSAVIRRYLQETEPQYLKMLRTLLHQLPDYSDNSPVNEPIQQSRREPEQSNNDLFDDPQMRAILEKRQKFYDSNP